MKVLVCGGRDYADKNKLYQTLSERPITKVISGMARGADSLAISWAIDHKIAVKGYPANWREHGKSAGPIRNQQMLDEEHPELVIAFPGGRGTADMIARATKQGYNVVRIE